jgi:hypothetical protein
MVVVFTVIHLLGALETENTVTGDSQTDVPWSQLIAETSLLALPSDALVFDGSFD